MSEEKNRFGEPLYSDCFVCDQTGEVTDGKGVKHDCICISRRVLHVGVTMRQMERALNFESKGRQLEEGLKDRNNEIVRICEFQEGGKWLPAKFHGWTKIPRCPIGDGSMLEWVMQAILEKPNGEVAYEEPLRVRFLDPSE